MSIVEIDRIISPQSFFHSVVKVRKVAKLDCMIDDDSWIGEEKWTNEFLRKKCGQLNVKIEVRCDNGMFGKGLEKSVLFKDFLDAIDQGCENMYMTTQELDYTPEGRPSIVSSPIAELVDDFPWTPNLLGNLIPQNINLWVGSTSSESSSGLHHDYHDNLYMLLRGAKRFVLYNPSDAFCMYTVGEISKVHPNGRINYRGQRTNPDGSAVTAEAAALASNALIEAALKLENARHESNDKESDADAMLEDALEAALDAEIGENDDSACDRDDDEMSDEESSNDYCDGDSVFGIEEEEVCNEVEGGEGGDSTVHSTASDQFKGKRPRSDQDLALFLGLETQSKRQSISFKQDSVENVECTKISASTTEYLTKVKTTRNRSPPNFSLVDTKLSDEELSAKFPKFIEARQRAIEVTLHAGQMLFIPAGWFHEVFSLGGMKNGGKSITNSTSRDSTNNSDSVSRDTTVTQESITQDSLVPNAYTNDSQPSEVGKSGGEGSGTIEVERNATADTKRTGGRKRGIAMEREVGHMALNYWFHPPDTGDFEKPYSSDFWHKDWLARGLPPVRGIVSDK